MAEQGDDLREQEALEQLDAYLQRLQCGEMPNADELLRRFPDLASAIRCLHVLERIAPPREAAAGGLVGGEIPLPESPGGSPDTPTLDWLAPRQERPHQHYGAFGEFELLDQIGRGGMGVVFRAFQKSLDRHVALKLIPTHLASPDQIARLQQEAKAAASMRHPNIVDIYQVGEHFGQPYIAMQYVEGPNLTHRLQHGPLPPEEAARLLVAIARAVQHLHDHGIVHRDLKPSNILLDRDGNPYVTDFGLAKVGAGDFVGSGDIAGTPPYMSPEQAAAGRLGAIGPASDIYSLGAILFEMLTGRPPFWGENAAETILQVLENEPPVPRSLNPRVPTDLQTICLKCLEKSPQHRYASAGALADDLECFLKHEPIAAQPFSLAQRLVRWARREPALAIRLLVIPTMYGLRRLLMGGFSWYTAGIVLLWLLISLVCQRWMARPQWAMTARFVWAAADNICFTLLLLLLDGIHSIHSPLIAAMPLLIVGAGVWFHRRLVWFVMGLTMFNYLLLWLASWQGLTADPLPANSELKELNSPVRHVLFLLGLLVLGILVAYQVARVRYLTRYFEQLRRR